LCSPLKAEEKKKFKNPKSRFFIALASDFDPIFDIQFCWDFHSPISLGLGLLHIFIHLDFQNYCDYTGSCYFDTLSHSIERIHHQ